MKGHNWGLCRKCGKDHGPHPHGMLGKKHPNPYFKKGRVPWNKGLTKKDHPSIAHQAKKAKGRKSWNKGLTKETDERVAKNGRSISKSVKGHKVSKETREKISRSISIIQKGRKCKESTKKKISSTLLGHPVSCEIRRKIAIGVSKAWDSKTDEEKEKLKQKNREGNLGKKHKEETKEKIRLSVLDQWQTQREKMLKSIHVGKKTKPNKFEKAFLMLCQKNEIDNVQYVGNGEFWITVPKKYQNIQSAVNPDFIIEPFSESKAVIELMGLHWHSKSDIERRHNIYKKLNIHHLFITDKNFYKNTLSVMIKVKEFVQEVG